MKNAARKQSARERLLAGAAAVFARDGLQGATTRAIAREAGVNEVTLFRLFQSKEKLLAAVVGQTFDDQPGPPAAALPGFSGDLRKDLAAYVEIYCARLTANLPLIRTMIGEIQRHREQERKVVEGVFKPLRAELVACLAEAQKRGAIRKDITPEIAADVLGGMVFTGVLRRCSPKKLNYSAREYAAACVDVFVRGIQKRSP
jgi:AcrR family transcriptional regulator